MITPGAVNKKQFTKVAELSNRNISRPRCLETLYAADTDTNMSCLNHRNIVCTVTNRQKQGFEVTLNKFDDQCLLKGRDTTVAMLARYS